MTEYGILVNGTIVNVVMTTKSIAEIRAQFPGYEVKPLADLSLRQKEAYRYWRERP